MKFYPAETIDESAGISAQGFITISLLCIGEDYSSVLAYSLTFLVYSKNSLLSIIIVNTFYVTLPDQLC